MILVPLNHAAHTIEMGRQPTHFVADLRVFVDGQRMRFDVRLVNHV